MNRTKLPIRKRLGDVPQFSRSTDAAIAEFSPQAWMKIHEYEYTNNTFYSILKDGYDGRVEWLKKLMDAIFKYNLAGYKTGPVDISKIRCFNCDELVHFATECRKPKKVKKDKAYLELEAKYVALSKKL
ncbi:hypothetical protein AgCh_034315 [Apium graveolens]